MNLDEFDYDLPGELVAREPLRDRDAARLMVWREGRVEHRIFRDLPDLLDPEDVLVVNDSRVMACRLFGRKPTGGRVEILLLRSLDDGTRWEALLKPLARLRPGMEIRLDAGPVCVLEERKRFDAPNIVRFDRPVWPEDLERWGTVPLPPYIGRPATAEDRTAYQTVYARAYGSVAAPTAGLHFTPRLLDRVRARGVRIVRVTLHVSWGTFRPVQVERIEEHRMHAERYEVDEENAEILRSCRGRRVCVGTTSCRVVETLMERHGEIRPDRGETDLFLYPGRPFRGTDVLVTNFHLPRSTLLMLVAAFIGLEETRRLYGLAVRERYRFYSYGDAMFLDPGRRR